MSKEIYLDWWTKNKLKIIQSEFTPIDKNIIIDAFRDNLKGVNLVSFLTQELNLEVDNFLKTFPKDILDNSWIIPSNERHITVFDFLPHNSGLDKIILVQKAVEFRNLLSSIIQDFTEAITIKFSGIIASPDGITLLGYVENDLLNTLRNIIRQRLQEQDLLSLEDIKYKATTAHISLLKFTEKINPGLLVQFVEKNVDHIMLPMQLSKLVLSISGRYYKTINSDIIQEYKINAKK